MSGEICINNELEIIIETSNVVANKNVQRQNKDLLRKEEVNTILDEEIHAIHIGKFVASRHTNQ